MKKPLMVTQVFTPTQPAVNTFVERESLINDRLVDALNTPGKQIVLYGHTGCGKTTFIVNKLNQTYENYIITRCMANMTFESIILEAFDQLGKFYSETSKVKGHKISPSITVSYKDIKTTLSVGEFSSQLTTTTKNILPPQLTPQRLAKFFGESNACWILEDFHKVSPAEKVKLSQIMKVFMDMSLDYPNLKLIAIGAVGTARQVIQYDKEMNNRVAEILIPYMTSAEIEQIILNGEKLLNIVFVKKVKDQIIKYSCGLPSICHQLCLNICFINRVTEAEKYPEYFETEDLDEAIEKYLHEKSDTLKTEFDKAIKVGNNVKRNLPKDILKVILNINKDEFSLDDIYIYMKKKVSSEDLEKNLMELCSEKRSQILVYDENSNKYRFNNLFLKVYCLAHFKSENNPQKVKGRLEIKVNKLMEIIQRDFADDVDFKALYGEDVFDFDED